MTDVPGGSASGAPLAALAGAAAAVVAFDVWVERRGENPPVPVHAPLDWGAHVVTALVALRAFPVAEEREVLVSTVAIDLDHVPIIPAMLRGDDLPRPLTHTFLVPLALAVLGRRGSAYGTFVHLCRDLFNGPGVGRLRLPVWGQAVAFGALLIHAWRHDG